MDSLKQAAWDVTDTNDQMGIAKALDKYVFTSGSKLSFFMKKAVMEHDSIKLH